MSYHLFLDDVRMPGDVTWMELPDASYVVVRTREEFCNTILDRGLPTHISFDNDLASLEYEGRHLAIWLTEALMDGILEGSFTFTVHSRNPVAAEWITQYLNSFLEAWYDV